MVTWWSLPYACASNNFAELRLIGKAAPQSCNFVCLTAPVAPPKVLWTFEKTTAKWMASLMWQICIIYIYIYIMYVYITILYIYTYVYDHIFYTVASISAVSSFSREKFRKMSLNNTPGEPIPVPAGKATAFSTAASIRSTTWAPPNSHRTGHQKQPSKRPSLRFFGSAFQEFLWRLVLLSKGWRTQGRPNLECWSDTNHKPVEPWFPCLVFGFLLQFPRVRG